MSGERLEVEEEGALKETTHRKIEEGQKHV